MSTARQGSHSRSTVAALAVAVGVVLAQAHDASAIPAFARKFNVDCLTCHSAPPYLNYTGRRFKEAGYRMPDETGKIDIEAQNLQKLTDHLYLEKIPTITARITGAPLEYGSDSGAKALLHVAPGGTLEFLSAGNFSSIGSYFIEAEAAIDSDHVYGGAGRFGFHPSPMVNLVGGVSEPFEFNPYNSLKGGGHGLTLSDKAALSLASLTGSVVAGDRQFIDVYGRAGLLFYSLGFAGNPDSVSGEKARDVTTHIVADINEELSAGVFGILSLSRTFAPDPTMPTMTVRASSFQTGVDLNLDHGDIHADGVFLVSSSKDLDAGARTTELGAFGEFFYTYQRDGRPVFMPLARLDYTTANNHKDTTVAGVLQASSYIFENARAGLEGTFDISKPSGESKSWSISALTDIVF